MNPAFETDPCPGRPRILFIGFPENSHTHSWIELLNDQPFNIRLFGRPSAVPPDDWQVRTYVSAVTDHKLDASNRVSLYPPTRVRRSLKVRAARYFRSTAFKDLT